MNAAGQPLVLEAASFQSNGVANLSLLESGERLLFAGNGFDKQPAQPRMMMPVSKPEEDQSARSAWMAKMNDRFDLLYLASTTRWYSTQKDVEALLAARQKDLAGKVAASGSR